VRDLAAEIQHRLAVLAPESLQLDDDSADHAGHVGAAGGGGHFTLTLVSAAFVGLSPVARHRKVYALLADLIPHRIHALSIRAYSPDAF
jgi:BolA protein